VSASGGTNVGLGNISAGTLALTGVQAKTGAYAMAATDSGVLADATGGAFTVTLPAAPVLGQLVWVKKTDASVNAVTVQPAAGTIDGAASQPLAAQNVGVLCVRGAAQWFVIADNASGPL
jgi:hypothetical protein